MKIKLSALLIVCSLVTTIQLIQIGSGLNKFFSILMLLLSVIGLALDIKKPAPLNLKVKLSDFADGFREILDYARNLYVTSDSLKKVVAEEHDAVSKSSSALDEISSMLSRTADSAGKLSLMSQDAEVSVNEGKKSVSNLVDELTEINSSTEKLSQHIEISLSSLESVIKDLSQIKEKTDVINTIVFQTRLLSFNASVEAARAGEHGRGFSVVAEEMSNLAVTSGVASKEINDILQVNLSSTQNIILDMKSKLTALMQSSREDVLKGLSNAKSSSESFDEITQKVKSVSMLSDEISSATKEQDIGVREITKATHQLQVTSDQLNMVSVHALKSALSLSEHTEKKSQELVDFGNILGLKVLFKNKPFDFGSAISAHLDWKMKLSKYMQAPDKSLDPEKVCKDNACSLGQWIYGDGKKYYEIDTYEDLRQAHADFHRVAAEVVKNASQGNLKQAEIMMGVSGVYVKTSDKCVSLIQKLRDQVELYNNKKSA